MNLETKRINITLKPHHVASIFSLTALAITAAFYLTSDKKQELESEPFAERDEVFLGNQEFKRESPVPSCNLFSGRWVLADAEHLPMYEEGKCSFMLDIFACQKYGRKDTKYQQWRWQPHDCDLPRFNGKALLEKMRGKRVVFVGDSLNKNQWISMLCLLESSIDPSSNKSITRKGNLLVFEAHEYNATIEFYWSPLLVESNCDDPELPPSGGRVIRIKSIEKHAKHWTDADILIFDSFAWWFEPTMTILWGSFGSSDAIYKRVEMKERRYEMALNTWSDWLEININRTKTQLFFMSLSPHHFCW